MALFEQVLRVLRLEIASNAMDLEESLKGLTVSRLKEACAAMNVKKSGTKAELIGRLLTNWEISSTGELSFQQSPGRVSDIEKAETLLRNSVSSDGWNKNLAFISNTVASIISMSSSKV